MSAGTVWRSNIKFVKACEVENKYLQYVIERLGSSIIISSLRKYHVINKLIRDRII